MCPHPTSTSACLTIPDITCSSPSERRTSLDELQEFSGGGGDDGEAATGRLHRDSSRSPFWDGAVLCKSRTTRDFPRREGSGASKVQGASGGGANWVSVCPFCAAAV